MNPKQIQLINLIRKINTEKDALLHSKIALLELNLPFEQINLFSTIFSEHSKNLSQILDLAKKISEE